MPAADTGTTVAPAGRPCEMVRSTLPTLPIRVMSIANVALPPGTVVADVVTSAFRSAGQRCSALRLLLVQEDIADGLIEMLSGAMDLLTLGDPSDPATDVGPVIDGDAYDRLMGYRDSVRERWVKTIDAPADGLFVPPTLIRLGSIEELNREWFGPILHVATWKAGELEQTIARVNAKGYGLGATLTWIGEAGGYLDTQAQASWYETDLRSSILGDRVEDADANGLTLSVEAGKTLATGGRFGLTPQAQLTYSTVDFDSFIDPLGARIREFASGLTEREAEHVVRFLHAVAEAVDDECV